MQVDISTNSGALTEAYRAVRDAPGETLAWALFGYDGKGTTLNVAAQGTGGLDELAEEFSDGRAQYAFARVIDDNTKLPKYVLVNWIGEGVPENKKGLAASHVGTVAKFLAGFHVQINARSERDVEPAAIMKKVRDSSGAKFSFQQNAAGTKPAPVDKPEPVGSNYKKPEIMGRQHAAPEPTPAPAPAPAPARAPVAAPVPVAVRAAPPPVASRAAAPPTTMPKAPAAVRPPPPTVDRAAEERERREREEQERREREEQERRERERREREEQEMAAAAAVAAVAAASAPAADGGLTATVLYDYTANDDTEVSLAPGDVITGIVQIDEGWWQGYSQGRFGMFPSSYVQLNDAGAAAAEPEPAVAAAAAAAPEASDKGQCARSLYDYQAGDDNELSFDVGEEITHIEFIDDGWWRGRNPRGQYGMFPSNYVELV